MRILLVEDDGFHQAMMGEALRSRWPDCEIRVATTCADALECLNETGYDAHILDLILPDGDAMEVLRRLRSNGVTSPCIMVTGQGDELVAVRAMKEGVSDYIIKRGEYWNLLPRSLEVGLKAAERGLVPSTEMTGRFLPIRPGGPELEPAEGAHESLESELNEERSLRWSLEKQLRHRTEFVANVSHDLRTPLTAVKNALEILQSEFEPGLSREVMHFLDVARRGGDRLVRILDDLLDMSRLEAGRFDLRLQPVDLDALCGEVVKELKPRAAEKHLDLIYTKRSPVAMAYADPGRIGEVVRTLVAQAMASSPPWSLVEIGLEEERAGDRREALPFDETLRVSVRDSAPPLASVDLETLFERHVPGQDESDASRRGIGLRLPLARELVLAHSGAIWASNAGGGNEICFSVPAHSDESVLLLEFEAEKKKARRQFSSVSLILFRLLNPAQAFGGERVDPTIPAAVTLVKVMASHIRSGTGKAIWWRGPVPSVAVLASTDRGGAVILVNRLRQAVCSYGAASIGLSHPLSIEYGVSVYPAEKLDGPELVAAALQDNEGDFVVS
ncbi:MAG TPA: hybrid sensor histidine kinase/response regulator [Candidatus Polarisedimenticolia bacterium]|jgi:signal transduction histidine kinase